MKLERYERYKDSGIEWIGEIPEHWEVGKLKTLLTPVSKKNRPELPLLSVVREKGVILRDVEDQESNHNFIPDDLSNYKVVEKGQFVMNKMKAWQGSYGVSEYTGIVSPAYYVFKLSSVQPKFFHIAIRSKSTYVPFFMRASDGVRIGQWDLSKDRMKEILFYIPPKDEQEKIVFFIKDKTAQIDKAITLKEQLIERLKERRQILINDAVTKGLDKTVKMKDSGIEWIGEIPEHWEVRKLRTLLTPVSKKNRPELPLLSVVREKGVILRDIEDQESNHNFIPDDLSNYKVVEKGQFVMNKMKAWQGSYGVCEYTGIVSPAYYVFKLNKVQPEFFHIAIRSKSTYVPFFMRASDGVRIGQWDLSKDRMKEIPFYIPPKDEQEEIVSFIKDKTAQIDTAIELKQKQIEKLKEYRASLIDSVVTGKVRI